MYVISLSKPQIRKLTYSAVCLALCMILPFLTGQIPQIGSALCPMHIPVLLAGFLCGPWWAMAVGAVAPLLRFALFGMPPLFPTGAAMCFELAAYGLVSGLLYTRLMADALVSYEHSFFYGISNPYQGWGSSDERITMYATDDKIPVTYNIGNYGYQYKMSFRFRLAHNTELFEERYILFIREMLVCLG